ncbi:hypothetical protein [Neobacillus mesonae]|uniref:hypothetical protein n=1 Tax=Neobacillus mesonae TaxID=1193713 RepID=UPI002E245E87|nr:hypothetical protein [Neobacillus mesonae]
MKIGLCYVTKTYQINENKNRDWSIKILYPNPPHEKIGGTISRVEGNRYMVTISGYHNEINEKEVIKSNQGFLDVAEKLPKLDIYKEIEGATPLTETSIYRVPHITWRRLDKVKHLPEGLLLIGDTICRIDPVFGQGMSIAVLEALALQKLFQKPYKSITFEFHKQAAKIISPIWNMVITEDFRYSETIGKKPLGLPFLQWYAKHIFLLSGEKQEIYNSFVKPCQSNDHPHASQNH